MSAAGRFALVVVASPLWVMCVAMVVGICIDVYKQWRNL